MADTILTRDIKLVGFDELEKRLAQLPSNVTRKVLRNAMTSGARLIRKAVKEKVQTFTKSGTLLKSIFMRVRRVTDKSMTIEIGSTKHAFYGYILEVTGSAPHEIKAPEGKTLAIREKGSRGNVFVKSVMHPGFPRRRWLEPAFDQNAEQALDKIKENLGKGIEREAQKASGTA